MTSQSPNRFTWVEPGVFEVSEGVYRIPLPLPNDGLRAINLYLIVEDGNLTCIDSGWSIPESKELLAKGLKSLGFDLADISRFLITHVHRDHYTQALDIRKNLGTKIALGAKEKPSLDLYRAHSRNPMFAQMDRLREVGAHAIADTISDWMNEHGEDGLGWDPPDEWMEDGPVELKERTLNAIETPGHTAGHLVFHDHKAALLFAGDHVLPTITPSIGFEPVLQSNPLGDYLRSLAIIKSLPDAVLLPGHGPVAPSTHARVDQLFDHHAERLNLIEKEVAAVLVDAFAFGGALKWTRREHKLEDLDPFNAMLAVLEVSAHLEVLVIQGRVKESITEGQSTYTAP
jgi:glyoxylase-like metal-dependent hydrolase (beta-lactamase superfamily II)